MDTRISLHVPINQDGAVYGGKYWEHIIYYRHEVQVTINGRKCRAHIVTDQHANDSFLAANTERYEEHLIQRLQSEVVGFLKDEIFRGAQIERH